MERTLFLAPVQFTFFSLLVWEQRAHAYLLLPPFFNRLLTISDVAKKIPILHEMVFPLDWLAQKAEEDPQGRTNRGVQEEVCIFIFRAKRFTGSKQEESAKMDQI